MNERDVNEIRAFIAHIRNRTTNTIAEWNLMLEAERALEREEGFNIVHAATG